MGNAHVCGWRTPPPRRHGPASPRAASDDMPDTGTARSRNSYRLLKLLDAPRLAPPGDSCSPRHDFPAALQPAAGSDNPGLEAAALPPLQIPRTADRYTLGLVGRAKPTPINGVVGFIGFDKCRETNSIKKVLAVWHKLGYTYVRTKCEHQAGHCRLAGRRIGRRRAAPRRNGFQAPNGPHATFPPGRDQPTVHGGRPHGSFSAERAPARGQPVTPGC